MRYRPLRCVSLLVSISANLAACRAPVRPGALPGACESLFDGRTLSGWERLGDGQFVVADGAIAGVSVPGASTSFLRTTRDFADFDLTLEFAIDSGFNSGLQFRSIEAPAALTAVWHYGDGRPRERSWPAGTVVGYQAEIDRRPELVGVVLEDVGRGFFDLTPAAPGFRARSALLPPSWSQLRIRAVGDSIRTWVNGAPVTDIRDPSPTVARRSGFLALQLYAIRRPEDAGVHVRWRAVRLCRP